MTKIKRAFVITEKAASYNLLRTINAGRALWEDESAEPTPLQTVITKILVPDTGTKRFVVHLTFDELKKLYLKPGGGADLIDQIKDPELQKIITDPSSKESKIEMMKDDFKFSNLIDVGDKKADFTVLINVPDALATEFAAAGDKLDVARESLKKMMSHDFYVCTINNSKAAPIAQAVDGAEEMEQREKVLDPNVLENYPSKQTFVGAKNAWAELHAEHSKPAEEEPESENPAEKAEADLAASAQGNAPKPEEEKPAGEQEAPQETGTDIETSQKMADYWNAWQKKNPKVVTKQMRDIARQILKKNVG